MATEPRDPGVGVAYFRVDPSEPVVLQFVDGTVEILVAKKVALKTKEYIERTTWAVAGVYVLLGLPLDRGAGAPEPLVRARPGMGRDLLERLDKHLVHPDMGWFDRAVLVRDTRQGFNSAEAGFLEGRLHDLCRDAARVEHDFRRDSDETLQEWEQSELDRRYVPRIRAVLELVGVPTETAAAVAAAEAALVRRRGDEGTPA